MQKVLDFLRGRVCVQPREKEKRESKREKRRNGERERLMKVYLIFLDNRTTRYDFKKAK